MADLWRTRLIWAALGAAAAVAAIRLSAPSPNAPPAAPRADAQAPSRAVASAAPVTPSPPVASTAEVAPSPVVLAPAEPVASKPVAPSPPAPDAGDPRPAPTTVPTATIDERADAPTEPPTAAPEYPLPRMPGMSNLRRTDRYDDELGRWVITRASRVPAPASAVESFYTKALEAEGMSVSRVDEPPDASGTRRVTLKARGKNGKAQVAIRQPAGELSTTARVIWQPGA